MAIPRDTPDTESPGETGSAAEGEPVAEDTPGTNRTQHEPNPREKPIPDPSLERKYHPESPYTAGNY